MNIILQKLGVVLILLLSPLLVWGQSVNLPTFQNMPVTYAFTSTPSSPSLLNAYRPQHGTVTWTGSSNAGYTLVYTPDQDYIGTDHFRMVRWTLTPNIGYAYLDVTVTVTPALVLAYHDYAVTNMNQTVVIDVLANDLSSNGIKVLQAIPAINHGTATFNAQTGLVSFTPDTDFTGVAHFNYAVCNGMGDCDEGTVSVTVLGNGGSQGNEVITVFTKKNKSQFILVPPTYTLVQGPAHGVYDSGADVPEYTPSANYTGNDEIRFSSGTHLITYDIRVLNLADRTFAFDDRAFTTMNTPVDIAIRANDLSQSMCGLAIYDLPRHGTVQLLNGEAVYTPTPGFVGVDKFTYRSFIGACTGAVEIATVTVFVSNFAPDRSTFEMGTPKQTPIIIGYNVPVATYSFEVTSPGELGTTLFLAGAVDTIINGIPIQGDNILIYIPNDDVESGVDELEITYCLADAASSGNGCLVSKQVKIFMTILDLDLEGAIPCVGDCVWAGDTNSDGIVDMNDLLPLGMRMGEIGNERAGATMDVWYGQYADDWGVLFGGANQLDIKHIDADGNSIVTSADTVAIREFYGRTHNMIPSQMGYAPYEFVLEGPLFVNPGDYVEYTIRLGSVARPAEDVYGFVFPLSYNPVVIVPNSVHVNWNGSNFMAYDSPVLYMAHNDGLGRFDAGYTRVSGLVASGYGTLGTLGIVVDDLQGIRSDASELTVTLGGDYGSSLDKYGQYQSVYVQPFDLRIQLREDEGSADAAVDLDALLKTYPNPTGGYLNVHLNGGQVFEQVTLTALTGQVVQHQGGLRTQHTVLDLGQLPAGIYILSVTADQQTVNRKIQVLR